MGSEAYPREIKDLGDLLPAEKAVLEKVCAGEKAVLGAAVPDAPSDAVKIRAGFVRYLALGGCAAHQVHEKGIWVEGAWIEGRVDLDFCEVKGRFYLRSLVRWLRG